VQFISIQSTPSRKAEKRKRADEGVGGAGFGHRENETLKVVQPGRVVSSISWPC